MDVKKESTGWRDEHLSKRHRIWGYDCPAMDIDFLMIEYDRFVPKALIDYKCNSDMAIGQAGFKVLNNLGNMASIPAFWVRYTPDMKLFDVNPINDIARKIAFKNSKGITVCIFSIQCPLILTEERFVNFLLFLRSKHILTQPT